MKKFKINLRNEKIGESFEEFVSFITFQEAARSAYSRKYSLGYDWSVTSVSLVSSETDASDQMNFEFID